ncbi:MAG: aromatic ring-hydroxylating dioxygenase subunit alpha [Gammaproteobacteria bacterium]
MNAPRNPLEDVYYWPKAINEVPKEIFLREDIYQLELEKLFNGPLWHPVAHVSEVPNPGDYKTSYLGEVPILVIHGEDGQVRVFQNACTHRGTMLVTGFMGNKPEFECPYHRWIFDGTGALRVCPGDDNFPEDFNKQKFHLEEITTENFLGLLFITLDPQNAPPLLDTLGRTAEHLEQTLGGDGRLKLLGYQKVTYNANWKAYRDNDGYHPPLLHAAFRLLNWQGGGGFCAVEKNGNLALVSQLKESEKNGFLKDESILDFKGVDPSQGSYVILPSLLTVATKHLDMINIRFPMPRGVNQTEVHWAYFAHEDDDEEMVKHRLNQSSNLLGPSGLVSLEDAAVFHRIQKAATTSPSSSYFLKGIVEGMDPYNGAQNDEVANTVWWEYYRDQMGFPRNTS